MKTRNLLSALAIIASLFAGSAHASIIYKIDRVIGEGFVTGTITTDGTLGNLSTETCNYGECNDGGGVNIIDWNLYLFDGTGGFRLGRGDSLWTWGYGNQPGSSNFWATPSSLLYDFGASGFALFQYGDEVGYGQAYWCFGGCVGSESVYTGPDSITAVDWDEIHDSRVQSRDWTNEQIIGRAITATVSEPGAFALLALGLAGIGYCRSQAKISPV